MNTVVDKCNNALENPATKTIAYLELLKIIKKFIVAYNRNQTEFLRKCGDTKYNIACLEF